MRQLFSNTSHRRGLILVPAVAIVLLAGAVYFFLHSQGRQSADGEAASVADIAPAEAASTGGPADILLGLARTAIKEDRLVAPAGANAYEFYLSVLQLDPQNQVAMDALRETFPFASATVERSINQKELDEAQREIALLREFDGTNYTLVILGAKLDAQRQIVIREDERIAASMQSADARAKPAADAPPADIVRAPASVQPPAPVPHATAPVHVTAAIKPPTASAAPSPATDPVLLHQVAPYYPEQARSTRRQGWVDVAFVVETDGKVSHVAVADADPKYLFDRAATTAVQHWEFSPATRDGEPVAIAQRRRIQFTL
ncbi:MAG TPA: TonB family protein [Luteibacter sp.]|jgi:protein TonB|nr:TonB family protein [Luteibacter sp.]